MRTITPQDVVAITMAHLDDLRKKMRHLDDMMRACLEGGIVLDADSSVSNPHFLHPLLKVLITQ